MIRKTEELETLYERFAELIRALERMPARKRGSKWEQDRIVQRDAVRRRIERIEGVDEIPSYGATWEGY